jgi:hypothetical protein
VKEQLTCPLFHSLNLQVTLLFCTCFNFQFPSCFVWFPLSSMQRGCSSYQSHFCRVYYLLTTITLCTCSYSPLFNLVVQLKIKCHTNMSNNNFPKTREIDFIHLVQAQLSFSIDYGPCTIVFFKFFCLE